jgi:hypothetical protein
MEARGCLASSPCVPCRVIKLLGQNGHANQTEKITWARNWERVWKVGCRLLRLVTCIGLAHVAACFHLQMNLEENCEEGPEGNCKIVVS